LVRWFNLTDSAWLMIIALMTGVTTAIQCFEMWMLVKSSRQTNRILQDPAPIVKGFLKALAEDEDFAKEFAGFIAWAGQTGIAGVKQTMTEAGIKPPKIKSFGDLLGFLVQMPQIQDAVQKKAAGIVNGKAAVVVEDMGLL